MTKSTNNKKKNRTNFYGLPCAPGPSIEEIQEDIRKDTQEIIEIAHNLGLAGKQSGGGKVIDTLSDINMNDLAPEVAQMIAEAKKIIVKNSQSKS